MKKRKKRPCELTSLADETACKLAQFAMKLLQLCDITLNPPPTTTITKKPKARPDKRLERRDGEKHFQLTAPHPLPPSSSSR